MLSRPDNESNIHGTGVSLAGVGLLLTGAPGSGKSGLALRLMALGAEFVSDDRVILTREGDRLWMSGPETIRGQIEARGVGLLQVASVERVELHLVVDLDRAPDTRLPQGRTIRYHDVAVQLIFARGVPNIEAILTILMQNGLKRITCT